MAGSPDSRGQVLVVDDEPTIAEVVARYLDRAGYETRIAADGPSAVAEATRSRPDLLELKPLPRRARVDPEKLQRVLFNLIQNAIRHTPPDGSVTVRAAPSGEWVEIEVADTGDGIDPAEGDRVFEPFVRADESRPGHGAGLGLAVRFVIPT